MALQREKSGYALWTTSGVMKQPGPREYKRSFDTNTYLVQHWKLCTIQERRSNTPTAIPCRHYPNRVPGKGKKNGLRFEPPDVKGGTATYLPGSIIFARLFATRAFKTVFFAWCAVVLHFARTALRIIRDGITILLVCTICQHPSSAYNILSAYRIRTLLLLLGAAYTRCIRHCIGKTAAARPDNVFITARY